MTTLETLFARVRNGEKSAEEEMFAWLRARFAYIAKRRIRQPDSEDIAQEVCLTILSKYRELPPDTDLEVWAYQVLRNKIGNYLRHREVVRRVDASQHAPADLEDSVAADPEAAMALEGCLRKLIRSHPRYARVLNLHHLGYSTDEICRRLGVGRSNLYSMLSRARAILIACLFGEDEES